MDNVFALRMVLTAVILIASVAGTLAFAFMKFPDNAVVIGVLSVITAAVVFFVQKKEKSARLDVYYKTAQEFGTPASFSDLSGAFERNGTRIEVDFPQGKYSFFYKVNFYLPNLRQKFSVQNKSLATVHHNDCYRIEQDSPLPEEYLLQSRNPDFLLQLLKNTEILNEILSYKASMWGRISISFEDGNFEMIWTPPMSEQLDGFYRVCRTAVVFHDELQKISVRYLTKEDS
jgi:hypothetical protein